MGGQEPVKTEKIFQHRSAGPRRCRKDHTFRGTLYLTGAIRKMGRVATGMHFLIPMN